MPTTRPETGSHSTQFKDSHCDGDSGQPVCKSENSAFVADDSVAVKENIVTRKENENTMNKCTENLTDTAFSNTKVAEGKDSGSGVNNNKVGNVGESAAGCDVKILNQTQTSGTDNS